MKDEADKKGDRHTWVDGVFGFLFGSVFRAMAAVVLVPLHIVVSICHHPGQSKEELLKRAAWLGALLAIVGIGWYEAKDVMNASPATRGTAQYVPQSAILGKWYPTGFVPRYIELGYEFLENGQLISVPFKQDDHNPQLFRAEAPMRGAWSITANTLNLDGTRYPIMRLSQNELIIALGNGVQIAYSPAAWAVLAFQFHSLCSQKEKETVRRFGRLLSHWCRCITSFHRLDPPWVVPIGSGEIP
jgi:hypothetical protein